MIRSTSTLAAIAILAPAAAAQCDVWLPTPGDSSLVYAGAAPSRIYPINLLRAVDHDGPGPLPPTLYDAFPLSRWNGLAWEVLPILSTANPTVRCLEALSDAAGGLTPGRLLLGGSFVSTDSSCRVVASFDGQTLS